MFEQATITAGTPRTSRTAAAAPSPATAKPDWFDPVFLLALCWRRKVAIIATAALAVIAMLVFVALVPARFTAVTQILVDPSDLRVIDKSVTPANQITDNNVAQIESQVRVLLSESVLRRMIEREHLDQDAEFVAGESGGLRGLMRGVLAIAGIEMARRDRVDPVLATLRELRKRVTVKRAERTFVIDIAVETVDPEKSARIANAIALAYVEEQAAARAESARRASGSLSARLSELKERVRLAEQQVEQYRSDNNIVGATGGQLVSEQQLSEINNQLIQARGRTEEAKARYDQIQRLQRSGAEPGAIAEAVQSTTVAALRTQYAEVIRREAELTSLLGARHPAVLDIHAQARDLRRLINEEIARIAQAAANDYERARANEAALARSLEAIKHDTMSTNEALVRLRELQREVEASRAVYEAFLVRAREIGEQQRIDTVNVRVISKAEPPQFRSFPPRTLLLLIGAAMLGLGAGLGVAFAREWFERSYRPRRKATPGTTDLPVLPDAPATAPSSLEQAPMPAPKAELRALRDVLGSMPLARHSVLLLSAGDTASKTTVALNLAFAATSENRKTLLIDADLRKRALSQVLAGQARAGLAEVLDGRVPLQYGLLRDPKSGLYVLPALPSSTLAADVAQPDSVARLLEQVKNFDVVLIDGPADLNDPVVRMLAERVDHIVVTVAAGANQAQDVLAVMAALDGHAEKIRGTMVAERVRTAA